jgi:hypothetical protein
MNSDDVKDLHDYYVFDPQGEVTKEERDQALAYARNSFPEQFAGKEEIPFIVLAKSGFDLLPSHLRRHCRLPRSNEKWLNRKP